MWNSRFDSLSEFPFRRLATLLADVTPANLPPLDLSIGEPKHAPPAILAETVAANADKWNRYPPPVGTEDFRAAAASWLEQRFDLSDGTIDPDRNVLPLAGTKEGIFLLASAASPQSKTGRRPTVLMPNPLYSVYMGAAVLAGTEPVLLPATAETGFLPDLEAIAPDQLERASFFYLCSPGNPQGAVASLRYLQDALELARQYDFMLVVDECYSEIYDREAPNSALEAALPTGGGFENLVVLHSLSKRSNAAGLRSGFIAGDPAFLASFERMRAYGAAVQPLPLMAAAAALWRDEAHVVANRDRYRRKIDRAQARLGNRFGFYRPPGGFFLWLDVGDGITLVREAWSRAALRLLPGSYLAAEMADGADPGQRYVRVALVHDEQIVDEALERLVDVMGALNAA